MTILVLPRTRRVQYLGESPTLLIASTPKSTLGWLSPPPSNQGGRWDYGTDCGGRIESKTNEIEKRINVIANLEPGRGSANGGRGVLRCTPTKIYCLQVRTRRVWTARVVHLDVKVRPMFSASPSFSPTDRIDPTSDIIPRGMACRSILRKRTWKARLRGNGRVLD